MSHPERLNWYRNERDRALKAIADITSDGRIVYDFDARGLTDATASRLAYLKKRAMVYERLIELCEKNARAHFEA